MYDWKRKGDGGLIKEVTRDGVTWLSFPALEETGLVAHAFSTRMGGVSKGCYSTMNFSFTRGDDPEAVRENYRRMAKALGVDETRMVLTWQTHTINVRTVTLEDEGKGIVKERDYRDVDGLITDRPGVTLVTFFADCVPLYFLDRKRRAIGLAHSGWRGTVNRMGQAVLSAMEKEYGTDPADVTACIGPSICQDCYEVSADVADIFAEEFPGHEQEILAESEKNSVGMAHADKKYQLDLWKANEIIFQEAGVRKEHLAVTDICTCCNPKLLFSHRASHGKRGNLGAFLMLK